MKKCVCSRSETRPGCPATSYGGVLFCTRLRHHMGKHVACSMSTHRMEEWADTQKARTEKGSK